VSTRAYEFERRGRRHAAVPLLLPALLLMIPTLGCIDTPEEPGWLMVGAYDAATLMTIGRDLTAEESGHQYVWTPFPGMTKSCGPAKAPDGVGVYESEAVANSLSPALAIVLERGESTDSEPLSRDEVRVALGDDQPQFLLQPAVSPRYITVHIEGEGNAHHKQLVRTQLQMELCMEHKTGRGWIGGDGSNLRQAFLLDPPDQANWGSDRRYFGGQRDPIPPLLGPPDACLADAGEVGLGGDSGAGAGALDLVPSDVWGASLRGCEIEEQAGALLGRDPGQIPLKMSVGEDQPRPVRPKWDKLLVSVGAGRTDDDVNVDLSYAKDGVNEEVLLTEHPLFDRPEEGSGSGWSAGAGMTDMLARVPFSYPMMGPAGDTERYAVLIIPNWQIVEGLRRLYGPEADPDKPRATAGGGVQYGVGWVLDHPELLFVQVPDPNAEEAEPEEGEPETETWLDLTEIMGGGTWGLRNWGYTVGMLSGRKPIALPSRDAPSWEQASVAHRAKHQSLFLGCAAVLAFLALAGLRRLPDLWAKIPEERVDYWPGALADQGDDPDKKAGDQGGGGDEGGGGGGGEGK